jgi:hypothetical protein
MTARPRPYTGLEACVAHITAGGCGGADAGGGAPPDLVSLQVSKKNTTSRDLSHHHTASIQLY